MFFLFIYLWCHLHLAAMLSLTSAVDSHVQRFHGLDFKDYKRLHFLNFKQKLKEAEFNQVSLLFVWKVSEVHIGPNRQFTHRYAYNLDGKQSLQCLWIFLEVQT